MVLSESKIRKMAAQLAVVHERVPFVNSGGCGKFALAMVNKLKEHGISSKVYVISSNRYNSSNIENELNDDYAWTHLIVKVGRTFVDATGIYGRTWKEAVEKSMKTYGHHMNKLSMIPTDKMECLVENITWNPRYDAKRHDPILEKLTDKIVESNLAQCESRARASGNNSMLTRAAKTVKTACASIISA